MFIPDPIFSIPDPENRVNKIPYPGSESASKNSSIFSRINCLSSRKNDLGCSPRIPDPGSEFFPHLRSRGIKIPDPDPQPCPQGIDCVANLKPSTTSVHVRKNGWMNSDSRNFLIEKFIYNFKFSKLSCRPRPLVIWENYREMGNWLHPSVPIRYLRKFHTITTQTNHNHANHALSTLLD